MKWNRLTWCIWFILRQVDVVDYFVINLIENHIVFKRKAHRSGLLLFSVSRYNYPSQLTLPMRTVRRLRLRFLRLRPGIPNPWASALPCCPLCYSLPCRNQCQAHYKTHWLSSITTFTEAWRLRSCNVLYGGPGGSRTRVQNTFLFASYSNNLYLPRKGSEEPCST